jgi:hypothetical protein
LTFRERVGAWPTDGAQPGLGDQLMARRGGMDAVVNPIRSGRALRSSVELALQGNKHGVKLTGQGRYRFRATSGETVEVVVGSPARYRIRIGETQMVLPYSYGFNVTKGQRTQSLIAKAPPRPQFLEIAVPGRTKQAAFRVSVRLR